MIEIENKIEEWHTNTFPNATEKAIQDKLIEECIELLHAIKDKDTNNIIEEIADVFIVSCSLLSRKGLSFNGVVTNKLEVNKKRVWGKEDSQGDRPRVKG